MFLGFKFWFMIGLLLAAAGAYAAHVFIVDQKNQVIEERDARITELLEELAVLKIANQTQVLTIKQLEESAKKQNESLTELTAETKRITKERDAAQAIFEKHNFTLLSRAKPELIEKRINSATEKVLSEIEEDSRDLWNLMDRKKDESKSNQNPDITTDNTDNS